MFDFAFFHVMPDYNVKNISALKTRIQIFDKVIVVVWVGLIVLLYYDISWAVALLLVAQLTLYIIRRRMKKELNQKEILAKMVEERTTDLRQERDKVVQESKELSDALDALAKAQDELVRKEKMATVGNLTSGLVDRILNPVNYINNFSSLTLSTMQELRGEIESVRDSIPADKYEDISETLAIINTNLGKINDHGCNTVRIVKAMEELIKTRHSNITLTDIRTVCRVNVDLARKHFAQQIELNGIDLRLNLPVTPVPAEISIDEMNKVLHHLISNSIYAVIKKLQKQNFSPEIIIRVIPLPGEHTEISVRDNGIGIEDTIKSRIFEPFFTTKPTSEAAGTGLYLCREMILNHKGTIDVESRQGEYTEFRITIPNHQDTTSDE